MCGEGFLRGCEGPGEVRTTHTLPQSVTVECILGRKPTQLHSFHLGTEYLFLLNKGPLNIQYTANKQDISRVLAVLYHTQYNDQISLKRRLNHAKFSPHIFTNFLSINSCI